MAMMIDGMTRKQFDELPYRQDTFESVTCDCIVILPGCVKDMHDSGYRCMDFVAVRKNEPVCRLSGCSDVIHIDGISGMGDAFMKTGAFPTMVKPKSWNIDCLAKSGLLRLWCGHYQVRCGAGLSSFELVAIDL